MKATVLVVEDNLLNLKLMRLLLSHSGYQVLEAADAARARAVVAEHFPDLILMDLQLPGCDGLELTRELRSRPGLQRTPVIAVTGCAMASDRLEAIRAGCNDFVTKPFNNKELLNLVAQHLSLGSRS